MTHITVSEMTYNVSSGTLNFTIPYRNSNRTTTLLPADGRGHELQRTADQVTKHDIS